MYQPTAGAIVLDGKDTHSMTTAQVNRAGIARERAEELLESDTIRKAYLGG